MPSIKHRMCKYEEANLHADVPTWYFDVVVVKSQPQRKEMIDTQIGRQLPIDTGSIRKLQQKLLTSVSSRESRRQQEENRQRSSWHHHTNFVQSWQTHVKHKETVAEETNETNRLERHTITHYELRIQKRIQNFELSTEREQTTGETEDASNRATIDRGLYRV